MIPVANYAPTLSPASYAPPMNVVMPAEVYGTSNISTSAVATTVATPTPHNNVRFMPQQAAQHNSIEQTIAQAIASASSTQQQSVATQVTLPSGVQAPFMAQLLAQSYGSYESQALVNYFETANDNGSADTLEQGLMVMYSGIKYLPSNAALPRVSLTKSETQDMPVQKVEAELPQQQELFTQEQASVKREASQSTIINVVRDASQQTAAVVTVTHEATPEQIKSPEMSRRWAAGTPSLVKRTGADAYMATFARNQENLVIGDTATMKFAA